MQLEIVEIQDCHNAEVGKIIKLVGREFGAVGEGFGPSDEEVSAMSEYYKDETLSRYYVAILNGNIVGGCGIASFAGKTDMCELKKLFLLSQGRGFGIGKKLALKCLEYAENRGYKYCYLDTLSNMKSAIVLYEQLGFKHLSEPFKGTIHNGCDVWMIKTF